MSIFRFCTIPGVMEQQLQMVRASVDEIRSGHEGLQLCKEIYWVLGNPRTLTGVAPSGW